MKIRTLWVWYEPEFMPNIVLAVDEFLDDEIPDYWDKRKKQVFEELSLSPDGDNDIRECVLTVPDERIKRLFEPVEIGAGSAREDQMLRMLRYLYGELKAGQEYLDDRVVSKVTIGTGSSKN